MSVNPIYRVSRQKCDHLGNFHRLTQTAKRYSIFETVQKSDLAGAFPQLGANGIAKLKDT